MEKITIKQFYINKLEKELSEFKDQPESDEYKNIKKFLDAVKRDEHSHSEILVSADKGWLDYRADIKNIWYSCFKGKTKMFIRYWKNNYVSSREIK